MMRHILLTIAALLWLSHGVSGKEKTPALEVTGLKVENLTNPLGLGTLTPRFSWQTQAKTALNDVRQTGYQLLVASTEEQLARDEGDLWDTGLVASSRQLWIAYGGKPLKSNQRVWWKVRVLTTQGDTPWSQPSRFGIGLLEEGQWGGRWIGLEQTQPGEQAGQLVPRLAARYLRRSFAVEAKRVRHATAYVAGLGLYRLFLNGQEVGAADVLKPAPSDYRKTIYYNTYDVTPLLADSLHVMVVLGNGKYFPPRQDKPYKNTQFGLPKCRLNIIVEYADGSTSRFVTDEKWEVAADGPVVNNNEYDGEEYDARRRPTQWQPAQRTAIPQGTLRSQPLPPMTVGGPHRAVVPAKSVGGAVVYDFGQNMAGWVSFLPQGKAGDTIRVRYAERLNADGTLYVANLRNARSQDIYVCNGHDTVWHPSFTYHGFRYAEVSGKATQVEAWTVGDPMASTGSFECSDTVLNRVVRNAWWGIASNYKGMPVDCPQRNERQPWLGDRTVGALGESFLFDNERLYTKWMRDICEAQREDGCIPDVAPAFWNYYTDDVTWPAALPFVCNMLWRQYGNDEAMRLWYPSVRRWLKHIMDSYTSADGLITKDKYSDWCVPPEKPELIHSQDPARQTDGKLIATAYTIGCLQLASQFAQHLGEQADVRLWQEREQQLCEAFNRRFLTHRPGSSPRPGHVLYPDSTYYGNNTATANLLPLAFGIVPDSLRQTIARQVVDNVAIKNSGHVACGVIGISWLLRVLSDAGFADVAWQIATQKTYPSWGYMAQQGATTIWELWNGDTANPAMNSGNHVMLLGDLLTWCFQYLGGIKGSDGSGADFVLAPDLSIEGCDWVRCSYDTPFGTVSSHWRKSLKRLQWQVDVPCNTTARLRLPDGTVRTVGSGHYDIDTAIPAADAHIVDDAFLYTEAPFASPHASTIVETRKGTLVAAYFGGTYERNPDCCIWVNIKKPGGEWSAPILAADGMVDGVKTACWNPVLTEMPGGELWLFYKVGKTVGEWTGWLVKSKDGGRHWGKAERLPDGFLGPIKNKPLLLGDRLLCGSSTEGKGWRFHVEIYDLKTRQWRYVGPVESKLAPPTIQPDTLTPIDCIQPSFLQLNDGRLQVLMRTRNGFLATSFSSDQGETWTPVTLTSLPNNQSGTDAVTLRDGRHALIYNDFETLPGTKKGPRTPLSIAISSDDGHTWRHLCTLETSPVGQYSYPAIIEGSDGTLHCTYTWQRKRVAYKQVKLDP